MDEMKVKLSTKFMRGVVAKLISKVIQKKLGCKIDIVLNDLDVSVIDGETKILTNVELKLDSKEFVKIMKSIGADEGDES
jgi:hypothetical protein